MPSVKKLAFELWCLDCKEIKPVNPTGNQPWIFIGRTEAEAEAPILWPPDGKSWVIWKDPDAGKDRRFEKGTTEDEMVRWHHWLNGYESEQAPGVGEGQGALEIPWTEKPSRLHSPWGSQRVRDDLATELQQFKQYTFVSLLIMFFNAISYFGDYPLKFLQLYGDEHGTAEEYMI